MIRPALLLLCTTTAFAAPDQPWRDASAGAWGTTVPLLIGAAAGAGLGYLASVLKHGAIADHSGPVVIGGLAGLLLGVFL